MRNAELNTTVFVKMLFSKNSDLVETKNNDNRFHFDPCQCNLLIKSIVLWKVHNRSSISHLAAYDRICQLINVQKHKKEIINLIKIFPLRSFSSKVSRFKHSFWATTIEVRRRRQKRNNFNCLNLFIVVAEKYSRHIYLLYFLYFTRSWCFLWK